MGTKSNKVLTPEFRVSFPTLFKAESYEGGVPKFSVVMVFPKTADLSEMKAAARAAVEAKWPTDKPTGLKSPFRDGGEGTKADLEGFGPTTIFVTASTKNKPGVVDRDVQQIIDPDQVYAGCYARATVVPYAYDKAGNRGVAFGLQNLQLLRDGERLAGGGSAANDFDVVAGDDVFGEQPSTGVDDDFLS